MYIHVRPLPGSSGVEEEFYLVSDVLELKAERDDLFNDAMVMALRLYGEDPHTFGPECFNVMQKWGQKVKAILGAG